MGARVPATEHASTTLRYDAVDGHFARLWESIMDNDRDAVLYRMVLPEHTCPFGVRAKELLEQAGYHVDDRLLRTREEVDAYKAEQGVATTPQVFIGGERIGGSSEVERFLVRN